MISVLGTCPVCKTRHAATEQYCGHCGLIFGSHLAPKTVATRPSMPPEGACCPACGRRARSGARICGACGTSLVWSYRPLHTGQVLANGRYSILRPLSKGGMGAIYVAQDHDAFDRPVVIKALLDYFDPHDIEAAHVAKARFLHEARTLATLRHPAIPHIFAYFADGPYNYIVMEYVEGRDLDQGLSRKDDTTGKLVRGTPYGAEDVTRWGISLCRVLHYLATRNPQPVIHQDIKPANILLDDNSEDIRLVDFGTARARLVHSLVTVGLQKSSVFGTQGYAAPEQYGGQSEPRSDVYALASTMYHLLTDDDPRDHPFDFPHLTDLGGLGTILQGALQNEARDRPTAAAFRQQLEAISAPTRTHALETPDGTLVSNPQELATWCEQHWDAALRWLYDRHQLSEQIARFWGKNKLAKDVRHLTQTHQREESAGLDAVLATLDPHGYGIAPIQLEAQPARYDFGSLSSDAQAERRCTFTNTGRRHVVAELLTPAWITASQQTIELAPGASISLTLSGNMNQVGTTGKVRGYLIVRNKTNTICRVDVEAEVSRWRSLWRRVTQPAPSTAPPVAPPEVQFAAAAKDTTPTVARVAASSQAEAQAKLKMPPMQAFGTLVVRNRGGTVAWFTKAERQKLQRQLREVKAEPLIEPLSVQCWHEFRVTCRDRATVAKVIDLLAKLNETKKGVTRLDLEILGG